MQNFIEKFDVNQIPALFLLGCAWILVAVLAYMLVVKGLTKIHRRSQQEKSKVGQLYTEYNGRFTVVCSDRSVVNIPSPQFDFSAAIKKFDIKPFADR